ncbi:MAG: ABC transporter ATP-binding protein, partial [Clostridiales bacterium]|nr:ABC transporter ATP-binding protein [Clostridiales bacterium]
MVTPSPVYVGNGGASLVLKDIVKVYGEGDTAVHALKGVSINFRRSEFVSILGQSGCGKTTLLNIIGGLDRYTQGDLVINGVSTKEYCDRDWDTYRNHSIGFVFQSYNLIPHQTVLENVEIALAISGVSKKERRKRAIDVLCKVGLKDQLRKKPSEMSGGQMQRVAIARALVNNPDIVLADEPTGALDTETSIQIMEILKEVSKDRLVIMVTHNPELAKTYSSRIINMLDGKIMGDSNPFEGEKTAVIVKTKKERAKEKKPTMSFFTAFKLSLKNLFTKKGRTALTSFAGSIGIIGIALILAVSQGTTGYINHVQETTLSAYPLTLEEKTIDLTSLMSSFMNMGGSSVEHELDAIYKESIIDDLVNALSDTEKNENDLKSFKSYLERQLEDENSELSKAVAGVQYGYDLELTVYTENIDGKIVKSDTGELMTKMIADYMLEISTGGGSTSTESSEGSGLGSSMASMMKVDMWQELLPATDGGHINKMIKDQYDVIYG